jgi:hypothetical protein
VRGLATAAAVVVLGGVGYGIAQTFSSTSATSSGSSGAATSSGPAREAKPPAAGPNTRPGMQPNTAAGGSSLAIGGITVTRSGTSYQPGSLGQQAAAQLAKRPLTAPSHPGASAGPLARQEHGDAALRGCVQAIVHGRMIRLLDEGSYQGHPALIIVVQDHPSMVYVTSPGCTSAHPGVRAQVPLAAAR